MRAFSLMLLAALLAAGESHPSWWSYASPEATALVGIQWDNLQQSVFAQAVGAELASTGSLGFPDLPCLIESKEILISSPALLAIARGTCPAAALREQAVSKGLKPAGYRGVALWISPGKTLSVAQVSDQLLLFGTRKTLQAAIDRNLSETGPDESTRRYSPLLARAARFAHTKDLWVVANRLPDPLANLFVPLDAPARDFQGAISVRNGLQLEAALDADSESAAAELAATVRQSISSLPGVARDLQVKVVVATVVLGLQLSPEELTASLRPTEAVSAPKPATPPEPEPPPPSGPQIIRILGLDDGPREIELPPPAKPF